MVKSLNMGLIAGEKGSGNSNRLPEPDCTTDSGLGATLFAMCGIALSAVGKSGTPQNSATKEAAQPDIPKSVAESVSGTLQFAEGNFIGLTLAFSGLW
jgi:hypothetical protein